MKLTIKTSFSQSPIPGCFQNSCPISRHLQVKQIAKHDQVILFYLKILSSSLLSVSVNKLCKHWCFKILLKLISSNIFWNHKMRPDMIRWKTRQSDLYKGSASYDLDHLKESDLQNQFSPAGWFFNQGLMDRHVYVAESTVPNQTIS